MQNAKQIARLIGFVLVYAFVFYSATKINFDKADDILAFSPFLLSVFVIHHFMMPSHKAMVFPVLFLILSFMVFNPITASVLFLSLGLFGFVLFSGAKYYLKLSFSVVFFMTMLLLLTDSINLYPVNFMAPFILSIIMFRGIILLYEFKHKNKISNHLFSFAYLYSFPQLFFPIMPIVDYKTFLIGSESKNPEVLWTKAFEQFVTGLFLFSLYKIADGYLELDLTKLTGATDLFIAVLSKLIILLKICALYIFSLGFISMFGIELPSAFGFFPLASSFRNYWKDVNRYWRDFLLKLIYYPLYFKLRKTSIPAKTFLVVMVTFLFSCFFHFYQLYFSSGNLFLKLNDIMYWMLLGVLVYWSNVRLEKSGESENDDEKIMGLVRKSLNVLLVQTVMSFLFFLWNCNSLNEFVFLVKQGGTFDKSIIIYFLIIWLVILVVLFLRSHIQKALTSSRIAVAFFFVSVLFAGSLIAPKINTRFADVMYGVSQGSDAEVKEEGYYNKLLNSSNNSSMGREGINRLKPLDKAGVKTKNILMQELAPNSSINFNTTKIHINSQGLRDKEYALTKSPGMIRVAVMGASYEMGTGVNDDEVFEQITEKWLNKYSGQKYELLNFAVPMYSVLQNKYVCENKIKKFNVDVAVIFSHTGEEQRMLNSFIRLLNAKYDFQDDFLKFIIQKSGVKAGMSSIEAKHRLRPYVNVIYLWCYSEMVNYCKQNNIRPIWIYLPTTTDHHDANTIDNLKSLALKAGFEVYTLEKVYGNRQSKQITVSKIDTHPNALGHNLIAGEFYKVIVGLKNKNHE